MVLFNICTTYCFHYTRIFNFWHDLVTNVIPDFWYYFWNVLTQCAFEFVKSFVPSQSCPLIYCQSKLKESINDQVI